MPWARVIAEGVVVVGSILLAFGIDRAWENRQEGTRAAALLAALEADFVETRARLVESLDGGAEIQSRSRAFLVVSQAPGQVSVDSVRGLVGAIQEGIVFRPSIASYQSAVATGALGLVDSPSLLEALADFDTALELVAVFSGAAADLYNLGALWELRRELGSMSVLTGAVVHPLPESLALDSAEYWALIRRPEVYATVEADIEANRGIMLGLGQARGAVDRVLEEIRAVQERR